ncbi:MAG: M23 family metallopeptidase [Clostridia bacterium]|nr:M23 family metallopeptidase [Clostridia bacterium]
MKETENKFLNFMRKNAVYLILTLCILAIGTSVALMLVNRQNQLDANPNPDSPSIESPDVPSDSTDDTPSDVVDKPDDTPTSPVDTPVVFVMPVETPTTVGEYSESMVWNSTLGRFSAHLAIDFFANEGTDVLCVYDGVVKSVDSSLLKGTTIVIDHGDGLETVYNSLADGESVFVGQAVSQGTKLGSVSVTNRQEAGDGAHLHFEVLENGVNVDPSKYLVLDEK